MGGISAQGSHYLCIVNQQKHLTTMKTGDTIPTLLGVNAQGQEVKSTDFAGKPLIIYFYPKDNTPAARPRLAFATRRLRLIAQSRLRGDRSQQGFVGKPCKVCRKIFTPLYPHQRPVDRAEPGIRSVAEKKMADANTWVPCARHSSPMPTTA